MIVENHTKSGNLEAIKNIRTKRAMHNIFSDKQIKIIQKMIRFEELTKTENEYYSRVIKPKMNAIIDLQDLAFALRDKL